MHAILMKPNFIIYIFVSFKLFNTILKHDFMNRFNF